MHRLFLAVQPPEHIRQHLLNIMGGVAYARWQSDEQLHLTLKFLGEINRHQANDIVTVLDQFQHPQFEIELNGIGQFDRRGRIETLWAGISPLAPIKTLHNKLDHMLSGVGIPTDKRAYLPHITLARFGREAGPIDNFVTSNGGLTSPAFTVSDICLYESKLTQEGSVYTILARYPLR